MQDATEAEAKAKVTRPKRIEDMARLRVEREKADAALSMFMGDIATGQAKVQAARDNLTGKLKNGSDEALTRIFGEVTYALICEKFD